MGITIDTDSALVAFKAEILKSLTPEQREKILSEAVQHLLNLNKDRYGSTNFRDDAMSNAISKVIGSLLVDILNEPENKAKLDAAARQVVDQVTEKISANLVATVEKALRGGY